MDATAMVPAGPASSARRPAINPALYRLWRDQRTVQLGLDPAVVLHDVDEVALFLLDSLDGASSLAEVLATGAAAGYDVGELHRLLTDLTAAGVLLDDAHREFSGLGGPAEVDRLTPDLTALSLRHDGAPVAGRDHSADSDGDAGGDGDGDGDPARARLRWRRRCAVRVYGATRVGVPLAATLAAAGVGRVSVADTGEVAAADCAPGGLLPADEGTPRSMAAAAAIRRAAPLTLISAEAGAGPHLAVLCRPWPDPVTVAGLQDARIAHLVATIRENTGVVGPLVRPGRGTCLGCLELHRTDRDPAWPRLLTQLMARGRRDGDPQDTGLAQLVVGVAAVQALAHLDGGTGAAAVDAASLEFTLPDWRLRRRSWPAHPRCRCGHPAADGRSDRG